MLKTLALAMALGFSGAAIAQQAQPGPDMPDAKRESPNALEQSAAPGRPACDFMSREEMLMCQATKQGDVSGVRNSLCDVVSTNTIERCLKGPESVSSDSANELRERKDVGMVLQVPR